MRRSDAHDPCKLGLLAAEAQQEGHSVFQCMGGVRWTAQRFQSWKDSGVAFSSDAIVIDGELFHNEGCTGKVLSSRRHVELEPRIDARKLHRLADAITMRPASLMVPVTGTSLFASAATVIGVYPTGIYRACDAHESFLRALP